MNICIIGSGLGGLACGVILAKNGHRVTVLEQGAQAGGCLQCFSRHGARFETGMHFIGSAAEGQPMHAIMRYLELMDDVTLSPLDTAGYDIVGIGQRQYAFANGREAFISQLAATFPDQRDSLERYFDAIEAVAHTSVLATAGQAAVTAPPATGYMVRSMDSVIGDLVANPVLADVLAATLPLYAAERGKTPFAAHAFVMDFYNRSAFRIAGGSDALARSMVRTIGRYGGRVLTRHKAVKIVCDDTHATGVEALATAAGGGGGGRLEQEKRFFHADCVISDIHPIRTLELTDSRLIRPAFCNRIRAIPQTVGVFSVYMEFKDEAMPYMNHNYYGYNTPTPWGCEHYDERSWPKGFLYMHSCDRLGQQWARTGVILSYMQWADVAQWADTTVGSRGAAYEDFKQRKAERLIAALERHLPGTRCRIKRFYTATPLTYRDYTGTERGSMYGGAKDITMGAAARVQHRTKIPNLLLTGQNTNSHGMQGVIVGAIVTCSEMVKPDTLQRQIKGDGQ